MKIAIFAAAVLLAGCSNFGPKDHTQEILDHINEINSRLDDLATENKAMSEEIEELKLAVDNNCGA